MATALFARFVCKLQFVSPRLLATFILPTRNLIFNGRHVEAAILSFEISRAIPENHATSIINNLFFSFYSKVDSFSNGQCSSAISKLS